MYYIKIENYSLKGTATITYVHRTCEPIDLQLGVKCMLSCDIYSIKEEFFMNSREHKEHSKALFSTVECALSYMEPMPRA